MTDPRPLIAPLSAVRLLSLGLLSAVLGGCEAEALELASDIASARGECTTERLQASDEECVRMMERYAGIGVDLMRASIGGVKALDRALDRMPDPAFDTAGIGYAISPAFRSGDPLGLRASPRTVDVAAAQAGRPSAAGMIGTSGSPTYHRAPGEEWRVPGRSGAYVTRSAPRYDPDRYGDAAPERRGYGYDLRPFDRYRRFGQTERRDPTRERIRRRAFGYDALGRLDSWGYGFGDTYAYGFLESSPYGYFYRDDWSRYGHGVPYGAPRAPYGYGAWDAYPRGYGFESAYGYGGAWSDPRARGYPYAVNHDAAWPYGSDDRGWGYDDRAYAERAGAEPGWSRSAAGYEPGGAREEVDENGAITPQEDWGYRPEAAGVGLSAAGDGDGPSGPVARPAPHRPGILLPPEERLRRPWIYD